MAFKEREYREVRIQKSFSAMPKVVCVVALVAVFLAFTGALVYQGLIREGDSAKAAGGLTFSYLATHPYAGKSGYETGEDGHGQCYEVFCPGGQAITDINFTSSG